MNTSSSLTSKDWLKSAQNRLKTQGIPSYKLDPIILLEDCLKVDRLHIFTDEINLNRLQIKSLEYKLSRRLSFEPLAYIRGYIDFYGRRFITQKGVLIPRPESEAFIEVVRSINIKAPIRVTDIGCGSGCLGITVKLECPKTEVTLLDISKKALNLSSKNAALLNADVNIYKSNLLANAKHDCQIIVANLPYVPVSFEVNKDANYEPSRAIYAGDSGLNYYKRMFKQINLWRNKPIYVLTESLPPQHTLIHKLAISSGYKLATTNNLVQLFERVKY